MPSTGRHKAGGVWRVVFGSWQAGCGVWRVEGGRQRMLAEIIMTVDMVV